MTPTLDRGAANIARLLDLLPEAERERAFLMERIRAIYLDTERDDEVALRISWMLSTVGARVDPELSLGAGNRRECRAVVVVGESGAGKSSLLLRAFRSSPAFADHADRKANRILISVDLPSPCTLQTMGSAILAELGYAPDRAVGEAEVWRRVRRKLEELGVLVLHIDEMHNVTETANSVEIRKIRKTLKMLLANKRWPVAMIVSGLPHLVSFMEAVVIEDVDGCFRIDPVDRATEVRRRCRFVQLPSLELPGDIERVQDACRGLAEAAGLALTNEFHDVVPRLIHATLGQWGTCLEFVQDTIELILSGEADDTVLSRMSFAAAWAASTGNGPEMNPFIEEDWASVDCSAILSRKRVVVPSASPRGRPTR